ncbi:type II-B CRISPR-associated RNA-guided endonuclease Cas9/Csx12 [Tamilnaduibacter salinus]|nr:type II-B CRISPR-associated RNA-guided endonuclease Cas9/Csx12 [Tamilnaduibacter salinus]
MTKLVSPIAVDQGARYTGIYSLSYEPGVDPFLESKNAEVVVVDNDKLTLSMAPRRAGRHLRRGNQRFKLARRLLTLVLREAFGVDPDQLDQREREFLFGLLKRRGFTFLGEEIDEEAISGLDPDLVKRLLRNCPPFESLESLWQSLSSDPGMCREFLQLSTGSDDSLDLETLDKRWLKKWLKDNVEEASDKETIERLTSGVLALRDGCRAVIRAKWDGHHPRHIYLENIAQDLKHQPEGNALADRIGLSTGELSHLIGNISNLPLRPLRRYFNDKRFSRNADRWYPERMARQLTREWKGWQPDGVSKDIVQRSRELLKGLSNAAQDPVRFWKYTDPLQTIPPYERHSNRRPPKCQSLLIDVTALGERWPEWERWIAPLHKANPELSEGIDGFSPSISGPNEPRLAFLQRVLDRSTLFDPYGLRQLAVESRSHRAAQGKETLFRDLGDQHARGFLSFVTAYHREREQARSGFWDNQREGRLLKRCHTNPPHKGKILHLLLNRLLDGDIEDVEGFRDEITKTKIGRSTLKGIAQRASDVQKRYGNALNATLKEADLDKATYKRLNDLQALIEKAGPEIGRIAGCPENRRNRLGNVFILAQLFNLLFGDPSGFSSTCRSCSEENAWRSRSVPVPGEDREGWRMIPLTADSVRPFDGVVRRAVDAQARAMARLKKQELKKRDLPAGSFVSIPVLLEQNRFSFSEDLAAIKQRIAPSARHRNRQKAAREAQEQQISRWRGKLDRIRDASHGICPYSGRDLNQVNGQIDHILPRAQSRKLDGTTWNHEANLIYCSTSANVDKGETLKNLEDLDPGYLEAVFPGQSLTSIRQWIADRVKPLLARSGRMPSFVELERDQSIALRHALFDEDLRPQVMELLRGQARATRVNGTQAWLARRFVEELRRSVPELTLSFSVNRIQPEDVGLMRESLSEIRPEFLKAPDQPLSSHAIDAAMVYAAASSLPRMESELHVPAEPLAELHDRLARLLPERIDFTDVSRKPVYSLPRADSQTLFKDTYYAERFLPLLVSSDGALRAGFTPENSVEVKPARKRSESTPAEIAISRLDGFLRLRGARWSGDLSSLFASDASSDQWVALSVDRPLALARLQQVGRGEDELTDTDALLGALKYLTNKKELRTAVVGTGSALMSWEKLNEEIEKKTTLSVSIKGAGLKSDGAKLSLPARSHWLRFAARLNEEGVLGSNPGWSDAEWRRFFQTVFPSAKRDRQHQKVRKVWSLPVVPGSPSGLVRHQRRTRSGQTVFQVASLHEFKHMGVVLRERKAEGVFPGYLRWSTNLAPLAGVLQSPSQRMIRFDQWYPLDRPSVCQSADILSVSAAWGSGLRRSVEVTVSQELACRVFDVNSAWNLPANLKLHNNASELWPIEAIGWPRNNKVELRAITPSGVVLRYQKDKGGKPIQQELERAIREEE